MLLLNYPAELHPPERTALLPAHAFLGSAVRSEPADAQVDAWLAGSDQPVVYVSLGSFLSVRCDVLAAVAEALRGLDVRVALAIGSTPRRRARARCRTRGSCARCCPRSPCLGRAALAVSHGGNNSVTEALTAGVPLLLLPLSTDQFAGAAAARGCRARRGARPQRLHCRARSERPQTACSLFRPRPRTRLDRLAAPSSTVRARPRPSRARRGRDALTAARTPPAR